MALNQQFLELQRMVREETGRSPDVSVGVDDLPAIKRAINKAYATLYMDYDWPHLRRVFDKVSMSAGERYYDLPTDLNFDRIEEVNIWWNGWPTPIDRGISFPEYAAFDSNSNVKSDPVLKWDIRNIGGAIQFEVWPMPASDSGSSDGIQFIGFIDAPPLVNDADQCLLDDELVVLLAASQMLRRQKSADADDAVAQFRARLNMMKGRAVSGGDRRFRVGVGTEPGRQRQNPRAIVRISS